MEQTRDLQRTFPAPRLEHVREVVRARRIAAWQATSAFLGAIGPELTAETWGTIGNGAGMSADGLARLLDKPGL